MGSRVYMSRFECAHEGCPEVANFESSTRKEQARVHEQNYRKWRCARHCPVCRASYGKDAKEGLPMTASDEAAERLRGVFTLNDDHADNRMLTALEDAATFGDLRLLLFERQRFIKALEEIATRLEMADLSVEGTEFQGYSRAMFRLPAIATLARKALSPTPGPRP